jgi:uncharacterized UPF0160 family protein
MKLITHSEEFHTDDVFATALLLEIFPDAEVVRSRDEAVIAIGDIVYDVGKIYDPARGRFDHHQAQAGKRLNGIIYSSFGLLWKEHGLQFCTGDQELADEIDRRLAIPIDANDNGQEISEPIYEGIKPFTIDSIVAMLNPLLWRDETEEHDMQFKKSVELATAILHRLRDSVADSLISRRVLLKAYDEAVDKQVVVMDKPAAVRDIVDQVPELLYLISPRPEGTWGVLAVSEAPGSFTPRRRFPEAWRAQPADKLSELTGVPDATFCHATGFYAAAHSREGASALAMASLKPSS